MRAVAPNAALRYIPQSALAVSEPHPAMFGNAENESPKANKAWTNGNWLKSRFHFSFAEYHSRDNTNFGVLRVLNDDLVQPARGFGAHPHGDMEIATYIVRGQLTHKDSMGSAETLGRGAVQFMSAGTGVRHSEHNLAKDADLRFIQMWIVPRRRGTQPRYGGYQGTLEDRKDKFQHLVADLNNDAVKTPVKINQDANIFVAEISAGNAASLPINEVRQAYVVILEGAGVGVTATNAVKGLPTASEDCSGDASQVAHAHDAFEVYGGERGTTLTFSAGKTDAHVLVIEMAQDGNGGRRDL